MDFTDKELAGRDGSPSRPALGRLGEASLPSSAPSVPSVVKIFVKLRDSDRLQDKEINEQRLRCFFFAILAFSCGEFIFGCT
jgi:hypothetical protein